MNTVYFCFMLYKPFYCRLKFSLYLALLYCSSSCMSVKYLVSSFNLIPGVKETNFYLTNKGQI